MLRSRTAVGLAERWQRSHVGGSCVGWCLPAPCTHSSCLPLPVPAVPACTHRACLCPECLPVSCTEWLPASACTHSAHLPTVPARTQHPQLLPVPACTHGSCLHPVPAPTAPACTHSSFPTPSARCLPLVPSGAARWGRAWTYRSMAAFRQLPGPCPALCPPAGAAAPGATRPRRWVVPDRAAGAARGEPGMGLSSPPCTGARVSPRAPGARAVLMPWGSCIPHAPGHVLPATPCTRARASPMHPGTCIPHAPGRMQSPRTGARASPHAPWLMHPRI